MIDKSSDQSKAEYKAIIANNLGMACPQKEIIRKNAAGRLSKSVTVGYPNGEAHLLMSKLKKKFVPTNNMSITELRRDLSKLKLKEKEHPGKFMKIFPIFRTNHI